MRRSYFAEALPEHPALEAWRVLRGARIRAAHVETLKQTAKSQVYRIDGAGPDGDAVIAKRGRKLLITRERRVYEQILTCLPMPRLRYFGTISEHAGRFEWLFLEEAPAEAYSPSVPEHRIAAARWLLCLHVCGARLLDGAWLPDRGPAHYRRRLEAVRVAIDAQLVQSATTPEEHGILEALSATCATFGRRWRKVETICAEVPATVVHGDFKRTNLRIRNGAEGRALRAFDWANCGWAVPAIDLAGTVCSENPFTANPDLDAYCSESGPLQPGFKHSSVARIAVAGRIFRCLDAIAWELVWLAGARRSRARGAAEAWQERPLINLRAYFEELTRASIEA